jgi:hypothetical protein
MSFVIHFVPSLLRRENESLDPEYLKGRHQGPIRVGEDDDGRFDKDY